MSVLVIGAGGLGCPALLELAASGVRRIGILEPDRVEFSNLHRQILYREQDVGHAKAECAAHALTERFPDLELSVFPEAFSASTHDLVLDFDVVLDGTDRFETKLAISDVCVDRGVPYVFAAVVGVEGQVLGVEPKRSACVRCLFDDVPPPGTTRTCEDLGVLGPVAGIVAAKQVSVALQMIARDAGALDRIWIYDGLKDTSRWVPLRRATDCSGCGNRQDLRWATRPVTLLQTIDGALDPAIDGATEPAADRVACEVLDLTHLACPDTYIETRKLLDRIPMRGRVWIHLSSDESARNVPMSAVAAGHVILAQRSDGRTHRVLLERGA